MSVQVAQPAASRPIELLQRRSIRHRLWIGTVTVLVAFGSIFLLWPVYFMFITSLKTSGGAFLLPIKWLPYIQYEPQWGNYKEAHEFMKWSVVYGNTLRVASAAMIGDVLSATFVAYGFARFRAPFRNVLFTMMLATL